MGPYVSRLCGLKNYPVVDEKGGFVSFKVRFLGVDFFYFNHLE